MNNYLIIKTESETEYERYSYIFKQFPIDIILWSHEEIVSEIIEELFKRVERYCDWQLFLIDLSHYYHGENPYFCKQNSDFIDFSQQVYWVKGKEQSKPPKKIYFLCQRKKGVVSGNEGDQLYGFEQAVSSCRFLVVDCSGRGYLEVFEKLKIVSLVIILASNDMPHEIFEAYHVYSVDLKISKDKLVQYLENQKEKLERREGELDKERRSLVRVEEKIEDGYQEFIPPLSTCGYDSFNIKTIFCGIKTRKGMRKWLKKKVETDRRIDELKKEQISKQKELRNEMQERMSHVSTKNLPLEDDTVEEIKKKLLEMQNGLSECYVELWKLDTELAEEKREREKELDKALENRFTARELFAVGGFIFAWMLGVFIIFLAAEGEILEVFGLIEKINKVKWWQKNVIYGGGIFLGYALLFVITFLINTSYNLKKLAVCFNQVLGEIRENLQENLFKYRDFFSLIYKIKIYQGYLKRNKNFQREQSERMKELEVLIEQWQKENGSFQYLYEVFEHLKKQERGGENRFRKMDKEKIVLGNSGKEIKNPLFYVEGVSISKEVSDEN